MTKTELLERIASRLISMPKTQIRKVVEVLLEEMTDNLKRGEKVQIPPLGVFKVRRMAEKKGVNPVTKQPMVIPAHNAVKFSASSALKEVVKNS